MSYSKYKDCLPEETLQRIKYILTSVGIRMDHILNKRLDGIYSSIVYDRTNWWSTGGKGTTELYCLASGYAESLEHLCNYCAYNYKLANNEAQKYGGFRRYTDEYLLPIGEAMLSNELFFNEIKQSFISDNSKFDFNDCEKGWAKLLGDSQTTVSPFFSLKNNNIAYLPDEMVGRISGSTGGGAGNTPYEALSHAFDEISERYVKYIIYTNKLTPPTIHKDFIKKNCSELYQSILQIERLGYKLVVKDASLGKDFPVVAVAIINTKDQSYMVKFGAHCSFSIALERCLTEMFQSYSIDSGKGNGHKAFHVWSEKDDQNSSLEGNWFTQLKDDTGAVPVSFFLDSSSWDFKPWGIDINYTNKFGVKFHISNFKKQGCKDIFIRDLSFLGFPVFKVYIPVFSNSHLSVNNHIINNFQVVSKVIDQIIRYQIEDIKPYINCLIECFEKKSFIGGMIIKNIEERLVEICYAALLFDFRSDTSELKMLSNTNKYARSVLLDMELKNKGYSLEDREYLFSQLTDEKTRLIAQCWRKNNVFVELIRCFNKSIGSESDSISWEKFSIDSLSKTHIKFKQKMIDNMPSQVEIIQLINDCI